MGSGGVKRLLRSFQSLIGNSHNVMTGKRFQFRMVGLSPIDGDFKRRNGDDGQKPLLGNRSWLLDFHDIQAFL